jgi:hypothetical protein
MDFLKAALQMETNMQLSTKYCVQLRNFLVAHGAEFSLIPQPITRKEQNDFARTHVEWESKGTHVECESEDFHLYIGWVGEPMAKPPRFEVFVGGAAAWVNEFSDEFHYGDCKGFPTHEWNQDHYELIADQESVFRDIARHLVEFFKIANNKH